MSRSAASRLAVLGLSHFTVDAYGGFLAAILVTVLAPRLGLSDAGAARLLTLNVAVLSLGQPLFGYLSDRLGGRWMVILAPAAAGLAAGSFLAAPSLPVLLALVVIQALAIAAFHPEGVAMAGALHRGAASSAAATAVFMAAGPVGQTAGPLVVTWAAARPAPPAWLAYGGVAVSLLLAIVFPAGAVVRQRLDRSGGLRQALSGHVRPLSLLVAVSAIRYLVMIGLTFAVPVLLAERLSRELAVARTGVALSLFLGAGAAGGIVGSALLRRGGSRRRAMAVTFALAAPAVAALPHVTGAAAMAVLATAGLALGWTAPIVVVMGQRVTPQMAATASALMLGVSWALGGPVAPVLFQAVRQAASTAGAFVFLGAMSALAAATALALPPEPRK